MQILFDNLSSVIIATMVLLMLLAVSLRSQEDQVTTIRHETALNQQMSFIENVLRRDMAGAASVQDLGVQPDGTFTFRKVRQASGGGTEEVQVTYRRVETNTLDDGTQLYRIERRVDGDVDGGSMSTITSWNINVQNGQGAVPADAADAEQIDVSFDIVLPFSSDENVERRSWNATYRPRQMWSGYQVL
jgi:hypothetical protein